MRVEMKLDRGVCSLQNRIGKLGAEWDAAKLERHTSPEEGCFLAGGVESVWARQVPGIVVECGSLNGFSSSCLSLACHSFNYPLHCFDSWEGLPDMGPHPEYKPGQFASKQELWQENVKQFGAGLDNVHWYKGWFEETLPYLAKRGEKIAMLFIDADLGASVATVMKHCLPLMSPGGLIMSHESRYEYIDGNGKIDPKKENEVWREIRKAVAPRPYRAYFLIGFLAELELK
jgi:predicted O-methyltransferase YrrM